MVVSRRVVRNMKTGLDSLVFCRLKSQFLILLTSPSVPNLCQLCVWLRADFNSSK